eukprot:scaffold3084_cov144-Cylindrotheca_fusiformis.AAC.11
MAVEQDNGMDAVPNVDKTFSPFGKESIHEIDRRDGNPVFARGAFGDLSIAIQHNSETEPCRFVAIKRLGQAVVPSPKIGMELSKDVLNEISALHNLSYHENIIPLLAMYSGKSKSLSLVFPYCPCDLHISLEWRRRTFRPLLTLDVVKTVTRDIFAALNHCHDSGIIHRDLKPGNLLVSSMGVVKLCDFGIARQVADVDKSIVALAPGEIGTKGLCTLYYRPPEVLFGGKASHPSVDMYSAGVVVAELITGRPIFEGKNVLDQLSLIFDFLGTPTDASWPSCNSLPDFGKLSFKSKLPQPWERILPRTTEDRALHNLLSQLVVLDPKRRLSSKEALEDEMLSASGPPLAGSDVLRNELIPTQLRVPILLLPQNRAVASSLALKTAGTRRNFFISGQLSLWKGPDLSNESIADACTSLRNRVLMKGTSLDQHCKDER